MGICWSNGIIYTMKEEGVTVESVYTESGKIIATGSKMYIEDRFRGHIDQWIDLKGKTMFPGFMDSHLHLIGYGESCLKLDLSNMNSREEVLEAVRQRVHMTPIGSWMIAEGWNENRWQVLSPITREILDEISPNHSVILKRICRHVLVANTMAIEAAKTDQADQAEEHQHGIYKDTAQEVILNAVPDITESYLEEALTLGIQHAWSQGLVGGHTEDLSYYGRCSKPLTVFQNVIHNNAMKFRAHLLIHHLVVDEWKTIPLPLVKQSSFLEFGAMKIFADGALGGRTALLSHAYADDTDTHGTAIHTDEELDQLVRIARFFQMPIAVHTIGDLAASKVLDVIERHPAPTGTRDRLIHGLVLSHESVERMKTLPIVIDIQPSFVPSDFPWVMERLGQDSQMNIYAWKTMLTNGLHCAGGSDAPIESISPLHGIHAAVTRTNSDDPSRTVYEPREKLSVFEAISLYTTGTAYASGHEHDQGMIQEGYHTDFTILNKDPFRIEMDRWSELHVDMTVVDENIVFNKER
ncbi:amidohydrolase [Paenibacillus sp. CMAA1364]